MLTDLIGDLPLADLSGWGAFLLLSFLILRMVLKGDVVPSKQHDEVRADRDSYRELFQGQQAVNNELAAAIKVVIPFVESADHALRSIQAMGAAAFAAHEEKTTP